MKKRRDGGELKQPIKLRQSDDILTGTSLIGQIKCVFPHKQSIGKTHHGNKKIKSKGHIKHDQFQKLKTSQ